MYLTLRFRTGPNGIHRDGPEVGFKVGFVWFEGVNDLHVQFDGPAGVNYCPVVKDGEYWAINPRTGKPAPLYSLEVSATEVAATPKNYVERLKKYWPSPNQ